MASYEVSKVRNGYNAVTVSSLFGNLTIYAIPTIERAHSIGGELAVIMLEIEDEIMGPPTIPRQ